ncbi:hypothetical protein AWB76_05009 [Caballeronia temeraria]|uniref:Glycosyltransferase RgtA/B/C/D-like domain-containing protein n=1 Tax=Caballeronia temeraria TaxID=1777137 RepID=A0A158C4B9_9BURK|nr:hypothetical protein [Caballeronia temeraria]SAK76397.1 hypothetical protein AWB76_05009 [Caballeronia temeraria]
MTSRFPSGLRFAAALASAAFALIIVWMLVLLWRYALVAPPSFDGAMNLNTAQSLLHGTGYGFFYDRFFGFPAQTDGPFILPAALAFWIGGVRPFTTQVVNLVYVFALVIVIVTLLRRLNVSLWLALFAVTGCLMTPGFAEFSMNGYGEIPMLVWFIGGLIVLLPTGPDSGLSDRRLFAAGLLFGVSYLTKVVALVCIAPAVLVLGCVILAQPRRWTRLFALAAGFVLPIVVWEVFRLIQLRHLHDYVDWWRYQLAQIRSQSGAKRTGAVHHGRIESGLLHLKALSEMSGVPPVALAALIVVPIVLGVLLAINRSTPTRVRLGIGVLSVVCGLYFFWWLFITPEAYLWLRRIIAGLLLLQCLLAAMLVATYARVASVFANWKARREVLPAVAAAALAFAVFGQISLMRTGEFISNPPQPPGYALQMLRVAQDVKALPANATLFGTGWWQSPVIALFSGRHFMNLEHWPVDRINSVPVKFLVTDIYSQGIAESTIQGVLDRASYVPVMKSDGGSIYRLGAVRPYVPFTTKDENPANLSSSLDFSRADYDARRGIYQREGDRDAWMSPDAAVLLKRKHQDTVRIGIEVTPELIRDVGPHYPVLEISSPGCLDRKADLTESGVHTFVLSLDCPGSDEDKPLEIDFHVDRHVPFIPQIDSDNRQRSVRLRYVRLEADAVAPAAQTLAPQPAAQD